MIVNLIIIGIILFFGLIYSSGVAGSKNSESNKKQYVIIITIFLILQSGLRNWAVGSDTYQYSIYYNEVMQMSWAEVWRQVTDYYQLAIGKDPGYVVFEKVSSYIAPNYQLYLLLIAIIFFIPLARFILKNTNNLKEIIFAYVLYACLYYSFFSITGHRQTIATAATFIAFEWIKKRKLIPFLILIFIASTIHRSCLIFIPFYFIGQIKKTKLFYILVLMLFPLLFAFSSQMSIYLKLLGGYNEYDIYEGAGTYTFTLMIMLVALVGLWRMKAIVKRNEQAKILYNAFALAVLFTPLTWFNPSAMRIVQYFSVFMMVLIPAFVQSFDRFSVRTRNFMFNFLIVLLIILFMKSNWFIEYKFFWQEMALGDNYSDIA